MMTCPKCKARAYVVSHKNYEFGNRFYRLRRCKNCGNEFTTAEIFEDEPQEEKIVSWQQEVMLHVKQRS